MTNKQFLDINALIIHLANGQEKIKNDILLLQKDILDIKSLLCESKLPKQNSFKVITDHSIAIDSWDYKQPRGAANDNTRCPWFVSAAESLFSNQRISHLDLGCAGGGLVFDFLLQGHYSIGIEGSDIQKRNKGAHWLVIPNNLFTADITQKFQILNNGTPSKFTLITAMEVMEHIPEQQLDGLLDNVYNLLADDGVFCCSIATFPDFDIETGAVWHVTLKEKSWWLQKFKSKGFEVNLKKSIDPRDFPRGCSNPYAGFGADTDFINNPSLGFHLSLMKI